MSIKNTDQKVDPEAYRKGWEKICGKKGQERDIRDTHPVGWMTNEDCAKVAAEMMRQKERT